MIIATASPAELDAQRLYALLRLRVDAFVVEQACAYPELDGRDLEPGTRHWWVEEDGEVVSYLRTLVEPDGTQRIGRVVTAPSARGRGLAAALMAAVLAELPRPVILAAQAQLQDWYARWDFIVDGEVYLEDGIPHVPMRLAGQRPGQHHP